MPDDSTALLVETCAAFADDLTATFRGVLGDHVPRFVGLASVNPDGAAVVVRPDDGAEGEAGIPATINGLPALDIKVRMRCRWDHAATYLKVDDSSVKVTTQGAGTPLWQIDFVTGTTDGVPQAHMQVFAHRDEFTWHMLRDSAGSRRAKNRTRALGYPDGKVPGLGALHFPLGGQRFRPCIEDVLQMLVSEFGIDHTDNWRAAVEDGRERWRRMQIGSAVRDCPSTAARVLADLGYTVTAPTDGEPPSRRDKLRTY